MNVCESGTVTECDNTLLLTMEEAARIRHLATFYRDCDRRALSAEDRVIADLLEGLWLTLKVGEPVALLVHYSER